eukprot:Nitzschia sp. Nitz4//scaffold260_size33533//17430//22260//NITZ4_007879-RA/size33533-augustus-gene-0.12-mRNA-1//1//CDS//3329544683//8960//frame0
MASVNKLSIRGVRSFSPDDAEQVLEFYFPCTIIVGANGCGKTTIIESLNFAVSGALPPGNKSGQAFVHDPRSIGQSSVKANIKLRFTGRAGNSMVVVRSMEVQQKKTTMAFKQLDGVLRSTDKEGNRVSMGHKCSELDRQLPLLLGVSKAILDNVIFCHQEDSSWPLQEGAVLKKKFDDIFDSTRYSKALDVFSKLKKEHAAKAKDYKADVAGFASHRHAAKGFRKELSEFNSQLEDIEEELSESRNSLRETQEEQKRLEGILEQVDEIKNDVESKKNELSMLQQVVKKQQNMLSEDLSSTKSIRELKEQLKNFDSQVVSQLDRKADLEAELHTAQKELKGIRDQESSLKTRLGRLEAAREVHQSRLKTRFDKMVALGDAYALGDVLSALTMSQPGTQSTSFQSGNSATFEMSLSGQEPNDGEPILDIPQKDMDEFFRTVAKKEQELKQALKDHKAKMQQQEDQLVGQISDILAKLKSIESSRDSLNKQQADSRRELQQINDKLKGAQRIRKSEIDEARRMAAKFAAERDEANSDPRRLQIPVEIRSLENKVDQLKREVDDDKIALEYLRQTADSQNAIVVLRDQCVKDLEMLEENVKESSYSLQQFNIKMPESLPGNVDDEDGDELTRCFEKVVDEVTEKYDAINSDLERANADLSKSSQVVSERTALLGHDQRAILIKRERMSKLEGPGSAIDAVQNVVTSLRAYERQIGSNTPMDLDESRPQELLKYLDSRLAEEESQSTEGIPSDTVRKIMSRLMKQVSTQGATCDSVLDAFLTCSELQAKVGEGQFACPCCTRDFEEEVDFAAFKKQMKMLVSEESPLMKLDERSRASRVNFANWKAVVDENLHSILEYRRTANEVDELERNMQDLESGLTESNRQLNDAKENVFDFELQLANVRDLRDSVRRWAESANRLAEKRMQVKQKELDLHSATADTRGRDLKTVEKELSDRNELREQHINQINKLNKEMGALNNRINQVSGQASRMEQNVREKERKMAEESSLTQRKSELADIISNCAAQEKKLQEEIAPLKQKSKSKETEKSRMRALNNEEDERLSATLSSFCAAVKELTELRSEIELYLASGTEEELSTFEVQADTLSEKAKKKEAEVAGIQPRLDTLVKEVEDQEHHKKNLKENIELIQSKDRISDLKREVSQLEGSASNVDGHETVYEDIEVLNSRKEKIVKATAHLEGRRGGVVDSIRAIKRKLSQEEYKNVDEEYRVAVIRKETTDMTVKDLERIHGALDKSLLKFHGLKIAEINKIIRDLWNLTYKGEDITNIEIVSGQETGSRTTRSYNYRVVMTKGSTQLDMRGRCSAGQRVLASIVIRLALAETFCVNFGCIALDEPTVNLDYNNKKGLAIALAQIIASRAQQSNFQLVLITHDEDFVAMMKTELSSQTGFQMPEKYFQVRREEGTDGKFYSKIDAIDWDELI